MRLTTLLAAGLFSTALSAQAVADGCKGVLLRTTGEFDKKGSVHDELSTYYEDDNNGTMSRPTPPTEIAEHGGGVFKVLDIKVLNCHLVLDAKTNEYNLVENNDTTNADNLIRSKIEERLQSAGVDHATATSDAPDDYMKRPNSACGKAVAKVMSGDNSAASLVEAVCAN